MSNQRPWVNHYPSGVPANIDANKYENVTSLLQEVHSSFKKKKAFSCMGKTLSYKDINKMSDRLGAYLQSRGLKVGDRVAIMLPNVLQYPIAAIACIKAGLVLVNVNPLYTPRELKHQVNNSGAKCIIILENFGLTLDKIIGDTSIEIIIKCSVGELLGLIKGKLVNFAVRNVKRIVPKYELKNSVWFKEALDRGKQFSLSVHNAKANDIRALQYTGGTTGVSKGAMLTHKNFIANILQMGSFLSEKIKPGEETILTALPLYHIFGFTVNFLGLYYQGAHNVLLINARDLDSVMEAFAKYKISLFTGVNTLFNALLNHDKFDKMDQSYIKFIGAGGMALQKKVADEWQKRSGNLILEGYGLTESSPVVSFNPLNGKVKQETVGVIVPSTDLEIRNSEGVAMPQGEIGELWIKGPQIMSGYFNAVEETNKVLVNGWLDTGDMALLDEDGYLKIVDRKKDMILVSGFNVYPNEIEDVVAMHPKILEVAAIGVPSESSGEVVKIFVVKKEDSLTEEELEQFCRQNLTGYKVPKQIEFKKELPKTNVGKILRRALKES